MGLTGPVQPAWLTLNRVDARGFVLDGLAGLCWIGALAIRLRGWGAGIVLSSDDRRREGRLRPPRGSAILPPTRRDTESSSKEAGR